MKKVRVILTVIIIAVTAFAWISLAGKSVSGAREYNSHVESAEEYVEQSLYQKAIFEYEKALSLRESEELRRELLDTYRLAREDEVISTEKYLSVLASFCTAYSKSADIWEELIQETLDQGGYKKAREYCLQAAKAMASGPSECPGICDTNSKRKYQSGYGLLT